MISGVSGVVTPKIFGPLGLKGTILKYNGSNWSVENSGITSDLLGMWGLNKDNIWAVGRSGTILKYDGSAWVSQLQSSGDYLYLVFMALMLIIFGP
ncbi:MAG: hypothetical protein IPG21_18805 [Saprospiraceae bacterium]|nr:hypothetical protein [Candidatus Vicinibacter affinis]